MRRNKKATATRYEIRSSIRSFFTYADRAWAEHSAVCYANFFSSPVEVFDTEEGVVICTKFPARNAQ